MSSFLKDLPCRNPESFTKFRALGASHQTSIRPTYTAKLDTNAKEIINDPVPLLIHDLSRLPNDKSRKRSISDDESEVPSFLIEQKKRSKQNFVNQISTTTTQQQVSNSIDYDEEFS
ncbi:unnamed protein product [Rotaria sordida]|uniref:Uncharacterized protein n=1 Tax=Rotaria sordida TaxID=392033 RepID=A0A815BKI3_9BILA|nr:unnamed protein product [Rotaria sordida]CAF1084586.1 unnamed protein product [Rotaria sordida]CAF1090957.1 unnamed protein product [Rotaria sordida]CAF1271123.1 unnamed protein product [Rotaria sordida]CAF1274478.1 unnamed protein product [Rotaria sordida]